MEDNGVMIVGIEDQAKPASQALTGPQHKQRPRA